MGRVVAVWASIVRLAAVAPMIEVPLQSLTGMEASAPLSVTPRGVEFAVDGYTGLVLPMRNARVIRLDLDVQGTFTISWRPETAQGPRPWRYVRLTPGAAQVDVRPLQFAGWTPWARSLLQFEGTGRIALTRVRFVPLPADGAEVDDLHDSETFWAPETIDHATTNFLLPPFWSISRGVHFSVVLAGLFVTVLGGGLALLRVRGRGNRAIPFVVAALLVVLMQDFHSMARLLPALDLSFVADPEERIRQNYHFAAEFGELAALARSTIGLEERVGALADPRDWFSAQTLCFNLAPRPCVILTPGADQHRGISGVGRASTSDLDVLVAFGAPAPLPAGFQTTAAVSPRAFIARRD